MCRQQECVQCSKWAFCAYHRLRHIPGVRGQQSTPRQPPTLFVVSFRGSTAAAVASVNSEDGGNAW